MSSAIHHRRSGLQTERREDARTPRHARRYLMRRLGFEERSGVPRLDWASLNLQALYQDAPKSNLPRFESVAHSAHQRSVALYRLATFQRVRQRHRTHQIGIYRLFTKTPQNPTFHVSNQSLIRLTRGALPFTDLQHSKESDNGIERIVLAIRKPGLDGSSESWLDYDSVSIRP